MKRISLTFKNWNGDESKWYDDEIFENIPTLSDDDREYIIGINQPFKYKDSYYKLEEYGEITFCHTGDASGHLVIPKTIFINGTIYPVTKIGHITRCKNAYSTDHYVDIENEIKERIVSYYTLEVGAFWGSEVTSCHFPSSIKEIEPIIWQNILEARESSIKKELKEVSESSLTEITFEPQSDLTILNPYAFANVGLVMNTLTLPEGLRIIGPHAIEGTFNKIVLPSTIEYIGEEALWYCSIQNINLPDNITSLEYNFIDLYHINGFLEIPSSIKNIPLLEWSIDERWNKTTSIPKLLIHNDQKDVSIHKKTFKYCMIEFINNEGKHKKYNRWYINYLFRRRKLNKDIFKK